MTAEVATARAYCGRCGRESVIVAGSIDPRYPLVRCVRIDADGTDRGHHVVPGLTDPDRAGLIRHEQSRRQLERAHPIHEARGRPRAGCPLCDAKGAQPVQRPHPWERIENRYRLVSHLDLMHRDRSQLPDLHHRPLEGIIARHAELHGDPTAR